MNLLNKIADVVLFALIGAGILINILLLYMLLVYVATRYVWIPLYHAIV